MATGPNETKVDVVVKKPTDPFFMVYCEGGAAPIAKHTREVAVKEAERIARKSGHRCYVLMAISTCGFGYLQWEDMNDA